MEINYLITSCLRSFFANSVTLSPSTLPTDLLRDGPKKLSVNLEQDSSMKNLKSSSQTIFILSPSLSIVYESEKNICDENYQKLT